MNREIKFRAFKNANCRNRMFEWREIKKDFELWLNCKHTSVMQYTGLKDKNGKEIYEGDQLHICAGYSSTVEFQDGMFVSVYKHPEDGEIIPLSDIIGKDTVIIGNIYEH